MTLHLGHIRPGDCEFTVEPNGIEPVDFERDTRPDPEAVKRVAAWCRAMRSTPLDVDHADYTSVPVPPTPDPDLVENDR